jgi:hypothetical protein
MGLITRAGAWCNGEVAYVAWEVKEKIKDCVGFMVTRVHETGEDAGQRRILPTWIAFTDQNNPNWNAQDSSVWPIQNFEWRDLTLRKSRDTTTVRPIDFDVHYEIVPVALARADDKPLPPSPTAPLTDSHGLPSYEGPKHRLRQMGEPIITNTIRVTHTYGRNIKATFTNGILSTQNLVRQLSSVNKAPPKKAMAAAASGDPKKRAKSAQQKENHLLKVLKQEIVKEDSSIRKFLMGDVYDFVSALVDRARKEGGQVYLALYELHDKQLITLLLEAMKRRLIHIILTTAGNLNPNPKGTPKEKRQPVVWDTENDDPRRRLHAAAGAEKDRVIDRMFNSSARIGHKSDGESLRLAKRLTSIADKGRFVMGAISDPTAMPDYKPPAKGTAEKGRIKLPPPAIWWPGGDESKVALIRAAAVRIPFGNLRPELLTAGHAIIHDKIIVIDPLDENDCTVITGSHNLGYGYKASYCNDENLLIITGNRDLVISYAVHVIDLYEHYLMCARLEQKIRKDIMDGKLKSYEEAAAHSVPHGLLTLGDDWQQRHLENKAQSSMAYFLESASASVGEAGFAECASNRNRALIFHAPRQAGSLVVPDRRQTQHAIRHPASVHSQSAEQGRG